MSTSWPGLRLAITTFTVWPMAPGPTDRRTAGRAMLLAPLVGFLLGAAAAAVLLGVDRRTDGREGLLSAALAIATVALLSRGLHWDGLADTADGLGSYRSTERALDVMRLGGSGPLGVTTVVLTLLVQVAALTAAANRGRGVVAVVAAVVVGRLAATLACTPSTPAARHDGLGALVAGTVERSQAFLVTAATLCAVAAVGALLSTEEAVRVAAGSVVALAVAHLLRRHAVHRLGGITGDVLGALVETTATLVLFALAL